MKKVVVFGSTGMTGICAVEAALKKGNLLFLLNKLFLCNQDKDIVLSENSRFAGK